VKLKVEDMVYKHLLNLVFPAALSSHFKRVTFLSWLTGALGQPLRMMGTD
jgi:hypothetical protein